MDVTRRTRSAISGATIPAGPDGPIWVLPSGVRIRREQVNGLRVTDAQMMQAIQGVELLPWADQRLMARTGIVIELMPLVTLNGEKQLGATNVEQTGTGEWVPTSMRIAVGQNAQIQRQGVDAVSETVQHEIGHVLAVLTRQDRSEQAAIAYAATH
ncbi:MAG: hypothetical protein JWN41_947 [Thermoleophilia bacterium]|nr:hypothetical protein [Thermoleophilia bacterium]